MTNETEHELEWFTDRIGKIIYRRNNICECPKCREVYEKGLLVLGKTHAHYLYDCQHALGLKYYDNGTK